MLKRVEDLGIVTKVVIPTAVMLLAALGIVVLAERSLMTLTAQTDHITEVTAKRQALALSALAAIHAASADEKNAILMADKTALDVFASDYVGDMDRVQAAILNLAELAIDPEEIDRLALIEDAIDGYEVAGQQLYRSLAEQDAEHADVLAAGAAQDSGERLSELMRAEVDHSTADMQRAGSAAAALAHRTLALLATLSLGGLILALLTASWITTRFIVRPLIKIADSMERISGGDCAVAIEGTQRRDEIGVLGRALAVFRERSLALREKTESLERAHEEIRALNGVLECRVEERTRALQAAHRELLARERLSGLGQLTATVAHELRNPLSTLRNSLHAIEQVGQAAGLDIARQMTRCQRTIRRCDDIINDLLDFAGVRELHLAPRRLDAWLDEVLDEIELPPGIVLERRLGAAAAVVPVDGERLRCAVVNLIDNAVEALSDASALAQRRIFVSTHAGDRAEIVIADTGPGMPDAVLARAFEPLFSTRSFGTGLGLPTVRQILEQHGGDVAIGSQSGAGTRVQLRLPLATAKSEAAA